MLFEEERKRKIAEYVQQKNRASVPELASLLQVSESTIRRDLRDLEEAKQLRRTHGGAVALQIADNVEPSFIEKEDRYRRQKERIARAALGLVEENDTIFLDSGTTTYELAKLLKSFGRLTVVTNSTMVLEELRNLPQIELLMTGGTLRHQTQAMVGPIADRTIASIHVDKLFLATNGIDPAGGLTTPNLIEAATKRCMIQAAEKVILLCDHSKFGKVAFAKFADLTEIHHCVIDEGLPADAAAELESEGIQVTLAKE
ncbi:DeoR/GlpR family DNA-binding transcription regulator [Cohnella thermotolerans]|jgi:DeoR family fructose operon transcriptional repressor|uniref:DeoR/GlpR family DNA-binding transcription regulator n=1 Tax=Cohnella thermotolerans TaxID=329858 RepID=UPI0004100314|nr:DeoR/GlpR family DNA-binding transcription regulator [Cohnella thermotolerans]